MFTTRLDKITDMLRVLRTPDGNIQTSALVRTDGLVIASDLPEQVGEDRGSAMSAAMLSLGERISIELDRGKLDKVIVQGKKGLVMLYAVGSEAVLTTLVRQDSKLGMVMLEMKQAARQIKSILYR